MNILMLNWRDPKNPKSGGAEYVTLEHCKSWVEKGHNVTWLTSKFTNCKAQEIVDGIKIVRTGNSVSIYFIAPFYYLFSGNKFDLIVDEIHGLPFFTPLYVKKPKIAFIHEVAGEIWNYMYPFPINKIGGLMERFYFRIYQKERFWTDAKSTIADLEKFGISSKNCTVISCPINNSIVKKLPKKEKDPTFIFVSRVVKMKGIEEVIRAFFYILRQNKNARLWIVGDGDKDYVEELKETMRSFSISPRVRFFGKVREQKKLELMRRAHLLLHASVKEGWGLVVIEAASQGTPAVVYNVPGLRDSVKNGETGIILKENSPKEMGANALQLINSKNMYKKLQKNCLIWSKSLTWEKATKQSAELIKSLARNG